MLRISLHASSLDQASRFNRVAWLDLAYAKLEPVADYKVLLFQAGDGASEPRTLPQYPRWSASLWDLIARGLALALHPDEEHPREELVVLPATRKGCAFTRLLCATIEHYAGPDSQKRDTLGTVTIAQAGRARGNYQARFTEHAGKAVHTPVFHYAPDIFSPGELLLHACAARHSDQAVLPPRPALCVPLPVTREGLRYVPIHRLVEPARTGFQNWLRQYSEPPEPEADAPLGLAPEPLYAKFLHTAI